MDSGDMTEGRGGTALKPVLVVLHQEHSTPGHVGRLLAERGHALDVRRPRYGDPLPETLVHHAGAVILSSTLITARTCTDEYEEAAAHDRSESLHG